MLGIVIGILWGIMAPSAHADGPHPAVKHSVQARWPMIQRCYESQLRKGLVGDGRIVVGFQTNTSGYVKTAWIHESSLDNDVVKRCVVYRFKKLKFKLEPGKTLRGLYPISFAANNLVPTSNIDPVTDAQAKTLIDQAIALKEPRIEKCQLREEIRTAKTIKGQVIIDYVVNENGKFSYAAVGHSNVRNSDVEACIRDVFRMIRTEKPLYRIVTGVYPVTLQ